MTNMKKSILKTPIEWNRLDQEIKIYDWEREIYKLKDQPMTRLEFLDLRLPCTLIAVPQKKGGEKNDNARPFTGFAKYRNWLASCCKRNELGSNDSNQCRHPHLPLDSHLGSTVELK